MKKDLSSKLEDSLIQLMDQKGDIQAITTQSILEQAGVSKATFYRHYQDKYELLNSIVKKYISKPLGKIAGATSSRCFRDYPTLRRIRLYW